MRRPRDNEYIICPDSRNSTKKPPKAVFDSVDPNGKKVSYGTIDKHSHGFYAKECKWTDLTVRIVAIERYVI